MSISARIVTIKIKKGILEILDLSQKQGGGESRERKRWNKSNPTKLNYQAGRESVDWKCAIPGILWQKSAEGIKILSVV